MAIIKMIMNVSCFPDDKEKLDSTVAHRESPVTSADEKSHGKDTGGRGVLSRVLHLAQRFLWDPISRQREDKKTKAPSRIQTQSPVSGRGFKSKTSASLSQAQIRARRRSQHRGGTLQPVLEGNHEVAPSVFTDAKRTCRSNENFKRSGTGPIGKVGHRGSDHSLIQPLRVRSMRLLRSKEAKSSTNVSLRSSVLPPTLRSTTLPPVSTPPASQTQEQAVHITPRMAFLNELSSRHQSSVPFNNTRESTLI